MTWTDAIRQWRQLSPAERREIRLRQLPTKVARSMAFAGMPVDQAMLEAEPDRLLAGNGPRSTSAPSPK